MGQGGGEPVGLRYAEAVGGRERNVSTDACGTPNARATSSTTGDVAMTPPAPAIAATRSSVPASAGSAEDVLFDEAAEEAVPVSADEAESALVEDALEEVEPASDIAAEAIK